MTLSQQTGNAERTGAPDRRDRGTAGPAGDDQALEGAQRPEARPADGDHRPGLLARDGRRRRADPPHEDHSAAIETGLRRTLYALASHAGRHGGRARGSTSQGRSAHRFRHPARSRTGRHSIPPTTSSATTTSINSRPRRTLRRSACPRSRWTRRPRRSPRLGPRDLRRHPRGADAGP